MSKHIDIAETINAIYYKWGGDPVYYVDDKTDGDVARRDVLILELLRSAEDTMVVVDVPDLVHCEECVYAIEGQRGDYRHCARYDAAHRSDFYCKGGQRRGTPVRRDDPERSTYELLEGIMKESWND